MKTKLYTIVLSRPRIVVFLLVALVVGVLALLFHDSWLDVETRAPPPDQLRAREASAEEVHHFCGACHRYPPPDTFPKDQWQAEVKQGYEFYRASRLKLDPPPIEEVVQYYENRAPKVLTRVTYPAPSSACPVGFFPSHFFLPKQPDTAMVSHVNLVHFSSEKSLDILACDMKEGWISLFKPYGSSPSGRILGQVGHPAHAEVVDIDGDGIKDILVADLGSYLPTDEPVGSVVLLKGKADGTFQPITLLDGVGRVADVQACDFKGRGKLDLIVAVFGWRSTGEIIYLENQTTDWSHPRFVPRILDKRHGAIHVPVADINGDGKPDFVALISQEHETIVAFLNQGNGDFRKQTIYTAPHPAYGSSGIQLVDLNNDGKMDVLYTNGDVMDSHMLKPYHSVQWLENRGKFPFVHHHLTYLYGVHKAVAADIRGTGLKDIVAVAFLPQIPLPEGRETHQLASVVLLCQETPGKFTRYVIRHSDCNSVSCAVGDLTGQGKPSLVTGSFSLQPLLKKKPALTIWELKTKD